MPIDLSKSFAMPAGKATGLKPRRTRFGGLPGVPVFRDRVTVIPVNEWSRHYGKGTKHLVNDIFDQDGVGSCASEAATQCIQIKREWAGMPFVQLSPWFLYRQVNGGSDSGSTLDDNVLATQRTGICTMQAYPRSMGWRAEPSAAAKAEAKLYRSIEWFDISTKEEFGTALILRFPVFYGRAGHAITGVEITEGGIIYANSWDESWGDRGFGFDRWEDVEPSIRAYGCFALRSVVETRNGVVAA
jgi:hypothetical protein